MPQPQTVKPVIDVATAGDNARARLKSIVERVERTNESIAELNDDKKDIYAEAKGEGWDVKAIKTIVQLRKKDPLERAEQDQVLETYMQALGMT